MPNLKSSPSGMLSINLKNDETVSGIGTDYDLCFNAQTGRFFVLRTETTFSETLGLQIQVFEEKISDHTELIASKLEDVGFDSIAN